MTYEGKENYIFISYAHKDAERVVPIVESLCNAGYRVWYDSGIEAGTEWPEYIEERLSSASVVLVFMTPTAIESRNCRNEINFALELGKEVLVAYLQDTPLLKGMRLQLNSSQSLFRQHHKDDATFTRELLNARILQNCREGYVEAETPAAKQARPAVPAEPARHNAAQTVDDGGKKKKTLLFVLLGIALAAIVILTCILAFGGKKGGDEAANNSTGNSEATASEETEPEETVPATTEPELVMSDNLFDFTLTLEGKVLQLPCKYEDIAAMGWTISSNYSDNTMISSDEYLSIQMSNNGKKITVISYNMSGNAKAVKDCMIGGIEWYANSGADIKIAKGITATASVDEIIAAYGTPYSRSDYDDYVRLTYQQGDFYQNKVVFWCYTTTADKTSYSSIEMRNLLATESDATETNPERPAYLEDYVAPTELGADLMSAVVKIEGDLYQFPAPLSAFLDNGWTITSQPGYVKSGATETLDLSRDGKTLMLNIANLGTYQTTAENCVVCGVYLVDEEAIEVELCGDIKFGATRAVVEAAVTEDFIFYEGSSYDSWSYYEYDDREFDVSIYVDKESGLVETIKISCKTWTY